MKLFNLLLGILSIFTISPIESIINRSDNNEIIITVNQEGQMEFQFSYYDENGYSHFENYDQLISVSKGDEVKLNVDKTYEKVIIEVFNNSDYSGEFVLEFNNYLKPEDIEVLITDEGLFELVDIKYVYKDGSNPSETIELGNHYKFKPINNYILPKIIELDKLYIELDEYLDNGYSECYLLLNHGLKGSDFNKQEEDFYKVPLECVIVDNLMKFNLKGEYYYDFNSSSMKTKKSNNSVKVNDVILSKNDNLLSEAYLVIEKFGYHQKRFQLDLLIDEKPLFGKNGYYKIKKLN